MEDSRSKVASIEGAELANPRMPQNANETVLSMKQDEWRMVAIADRESRSVNEIILAVSVECDD